jgi:hypothetical protein
MTVAGMMLEGCPAVHVPLWTSYNGSLKWRPLLSTSSLEASYVSPLYRLSYVIGPSDAAQVVGSLVIVWMEVELLATG